MDQPARLSVVELAAKYNFLLLLTGVLLRPLILPVSPPFVVAAGLSLLLYATVYYLIRRKRLVRYAAPAIFASTFLCTSPLLVLSGGLHSHLIYVVPLIPTFAGLMLSEFGAWLTTFLTSVLILMLAAFCSPDMAFLDEQSLPIVVWLLVGGITGVAFSRFFARENEFLASRLEHQANIDYLTRIPNRRGVEKILEREIQLSRNYSRSLCVMMLDLDYFKLYNDANGHQAGDRCLSDVGQRLNDLVLRQRGFFGRYGGEEFIAVVPDMDESSAAQLAKDLCTAVEDMSVLLKPGKSDLLTTSIGFSYCPPGEILSAREMISRADAELYRCKSEGRNRSKGNFAFIRENFKHFVSHPSRQSR